MNSVLAQRTRRTVLDVTRQLVQTDVSEELDPVGAGLDSISLMELATRLEELLGVDCSIEDLFTATTLGELSATLTARLEAAGVR